MYLDHFGGRHYEPIEIVRNPKARSEIKRQRGTGMPDEQLTAQQESDRLHSELNELFRQVREKEAEIDKVDRVVYLEDYK